MMFCAKKYSMQFILSKNNVDKHALLWIQYIKHYRSFINVSYKVLLDRQFYSRSLESNWKNSIIYTSKCGGPPASLMPPGAVKVALVRGEGLVRTKPGERLPLSTRLRLLLGCHHCLMNTLPIHLGSDGSQGGARRARHKRVGRLHQHPSPTVELDDGQCDGRLDRAASREDWLRRSPPDDSMQRLVRVRRAERRTPLQQLRAAESLEER